MVADTYKKFATEFEEYFSSVKNLLPASPRNLYEPVNYFLNLEGKRIRPLLVLIAADCFNGDTKRALPAAAAVELFHNFSLIHDDIMDKAPLRRGEATVHEKWNNSIAILSGDVLLVKAYQQISKCENIKELEEIFSRTAIQVCEGQQYDMDFETRDEVSVGNYLEMIRLKTAVLLACSLQMGAFCAGASHKSSKIFYTGGENLGLAFQLTDDYLDVFGNSEKTGKQEGGDIISNKKTWLLIKAFELANANQRKTLTQWVEKKTFDAKEKVNAVKKIFTDLNVNTLLEREIDLYYNKAFTDLRAACPNLGKIETFVLFIKTLMRREK
ncbi:MAG TPA: polyprenyl synthetase family protein [Bacteroidia bacterium]|jgi:geranylgeranyl diphosphate synthase type II|nr:polyprenyl synthetase family protein [Bacteroidia bacterium]